LEESPTKRLSSLVRGAFTPHRSADDPLGGRRCRGHGGGRRGVLARSGGVPTLAPRGGLVGSGRDGHVPDLLRSSERGVRTRGAVRFRSAPPARSVGGLALASYWARDARFLRGNASASCPLITCSVREDGGTALPAWIGDAFC